MRFLVLAECLLLCGCADRVHMTRAYGHSYQETLRRQAVNPGAGDQQATSKGLDTQEAAIIAQSYRTSLAHKGQPVPQEAVLLHTMPNDGVGKDAPMPASLPLDSR